MDSQIRAQELANLILSSSSPPEIIAACVAVESFLRKHVADQTRTFFSIAFPALIYKMFGFEDSSRKSGPSNGWIDQIMASKESDLAGRVFKLLSPSGVLLSSIFAVDRHSLVKYVFPTERLPEWVRFMLQSEKDCRLLKDLCPLFKNRIKEDQIQGNYQVQLNVFEYYMFWFAYYPVCKGNNENTDEVVIKKNRRFRLENWTSSFPAISPATRGLGQKAECSLYIRLLYAYLCAFVPNYGLSAYQPYRSSLLHYSSGNDGSVLLQAEFVVNSLIHFWLVDSDFSPMPVSIFRSLGVTLPFRAVLGETPPTAGLGEVVKLLVKYLHSSCLMENKDMGDQVAYSGMPRWRGSSSIDTLKSFHCGNTLGSWNSMIQRPLYRFILRTFLFCPMRTSVKNVSQVFSTWTSYMEPWKISAQDFSEFDELDAHSNDNLRSGNAQSEAKKNAIKDKEMSLCAYSTAWQGYVMFNYLFYSSLVMHFLGFAHKFLHSNAETIMEMALKLLGTLTSSRDLLDLLKKVDAAYHSKSAGSSSPMFDSSYKCVPSIWEQLQDWEDGLCESEADGSFLHDNWNNSLRLFSENEDGGPQLLQLFILRAEAEVEAMSGDSLAQSLKALDSLKAQMSCLFGSSTSSTPKFAAPDLMQGHQVREEVFTPKHPGVGKRTWSDLKYRGDWMRRPISDTEVACLAKLFVRISDWLNQMLGLDTGEINHPGWGSRWSFVDAPNCDAGHVAGPKEAIWMVLFSLVSWLMMLGQVVLNFTRDRGWRINLRVLASKKVVVILIVYAVFCALKRALGLCSHSHVVLASLLW